MGTELSKEIGPRTTLSGNRLLLVEDSPDQAELICQTFQDYDPQVQITWVGDGQSGIDALLKGGYTLVLMDYGLPRINGLETLILMNEKGLDIPVVMMTGQGDEGVAVEAMKKGAYDYIIKTQGFLFTLPIVAEEVIRKHENKIRFVKSQEKFRVLNEVSLSISIELDVEALSQKLIDGACRMVGAQIGSILLVDPKTRKANFIKQKGITFAHQLSATSLDKWGLFARLLSERTPIRASFPGEPTPDLPPHDPPIRDLVLVPLLHKGEARGGLLVANKPDGSPIDHEEANLLFTLAIHASMALENAQLLQETLVLAITDSLTGLYNHREFQKKLEEEVERSRRYHHRFSLLMMDIDHFKLFNDTYGHQTGDAVLKAIGRLIHEEVRIVNVPARYGGEEFAIILPETHLKNACQVAERIRKKVLSHRFAVGDARDTMISVSIGVASYPEDAESREGLITAADRALYAAKDAGRNSVCTYAECFSHLARRNPSGLTDGRLPGNEEIGEREPQRVARVRLRDLRGHLEQVSRYALLLARELGLDERMMESLRVAGLLHDIGILAIPEGILSKAGELTEEDQRILQTHPGLAEMILRKAGQLQEVLPAVLHHHERYDGMGYPDGLSGTEIPLLARILSLADAYHAMTSNRPYREQHSHQGVLEELKRNAGTQFDPLLVESFIRVLELEE